MSEHAATSRARRPSAWLGIATKRHRLQRVYVAYAPGRRCSVAGCAEPAACTVALADFSPATGEHFLEQDFTCPFLCLVHQQENERSRKGSRMARGSCDYPYSNRGLAQGWTEYLPLAAAARSSGHRSTAPVVVDPCSRNPVGGTAHGRCTDGANDGAGDARPAEATPWNGARHTARRSDGGSPGD